MHNTTIIFTLFTLVVIHPIHAMKAEQLSLDRIDQSSIYVARIVSQHGYICKQYSCSYDSCRFSHGKLTVINNHIKLHQLKYVPYKCTQCDYLSVGKRAYDRHLLTHSEKQLVCRLCQKKFKYEDSLIRHKKNQHSGVKKQKILKKR